MNALSADYIDWQYEVANGDTRLGFEEWLSHMREANSLSSLPSLGLPDSLEPHTVESVPDVSIDRLTDGRIRMEPNISDPTDDGPEASVCNDFRHGHISREGAMAFMRDILRFRRMV